MILISISVTKLIYLAPYGLIAEVAYGSGRALCTLMITVLQQIRVRQLNAGNAPTPVMVLSAHAMRGDRDVMIKAGADAYLPKPNAIDSLREEISRLCGV